MSIGFMVLTMLATSLAQAIGGGSVGGTGTGSLNSALMPNSTTSGLEYIRSYTAPVGLKDTVAIGNTIKAPANSFYALVTRLHPARHPHCLLIIFSILTGMVILVSVAGNVMVLLAFALEQSIRRPSNYFIASLAVTDLVVATLQMPLYSQYLLQALWVLGPELCDVWLSLDWTVCSASQYTVFLITLDRFLSVKVPARYSVWRTERKYFVGERTVPRYQYEVQFMSRTWFTILLTIGCYWIPLLAMCFLYGGIYKVALELQRKSDARLRQFQSIMGDNSTAGFSECECSNSGAEGGSSNFCNDGINELALSNVFIQSPASKRGYASSHIQNNKPGNLDTVSKTAALQRLRRGEILRTVSFSVERIVEVKDNTGEQLSDSTTKNFTLDDFASKSEMRTSGVSPKVCCQMSEGTSSRFVTPDIASSIDSGKTSGVSSDVTSGITSSVTGDITSGDISFIHSCVTSDITSGADSDTSSGITSGNAIKSVPRKKRPGKRCKAKSRAWRALRTITFILGAFALCWTPYNVLIMIMTVCFDCVNPYMYQVSYWMCYLNSAINPFCYAFVHRDFRKTFSRILRFNWHRTC